MTRGEIQREKLLQAIVFFVENTKACHGLKLFKLLYFLDFEIFRQTGRTVTGLEYRALPMGPVPTTLYDELRNPGGDMREVVNVTVTPERTDFSPRVRFDERYFTNRELKAMNEIVEWAKYAGSTAMTDASHEHDLPWRQVYVVEKKPNGVIPFKLALKSKKPGSITEEQADQVALEAREVDALFRK